MDDLALRRAVVRLYALDDASSDPGARTRELDPGTAELRSRCAQALWERLTDERADLRVWLSRLVRDVFLSETALQRGLGVEDACDFWSWFDKTMWREAVLRAPSLSGQVPAAPAALRSVPAGDPVPASSSSPAGRGSAGGTTSAGSPRRRAAGRRLEPVTGSTG